MYIQGDCEYILVKTKQSNTGDSFTVTTRNIACGDEGLTCTKSVHITTTSVRIRLILGAPPTINDVEVPKGRTFFSGGELDRNDMFLYVRLDSGVEILYDTGTASTNSAKDVILVSFGVTCVTQLVS